MATYKPVVPASKTVPEFTFRALFLGLLLGLIFGIGNAYLGLRVGTTVSASIPAAVLSVAFLRFFGKGTTILEHNLVQTIASVGEGLAAGVVFTVPALYILGASAADISSSRIFMLASLGGILGVLFMIPMRRFIIVEEHGVLQFPEGTACAEILKSAHRSGAEAPLALWGILIGAVYKVFSNMLFFWKEVPTWTIKKFQGTLFTMDCTPALLAVGNIVGARVSSIIFAGGVVSWWVLIPLAKLFGRPEIASMEAADVWSNYIRYVGAGAVAAGGIFSLCRVFPMIGRTLQVGIRELFKGVGDASKVDRTDRDISMRWLILGSIAIILTLWLFPGMPINFLTVLILVILGFFFVAVTSLTVGIVGSTSNPTSGMTITTVLLTCLIFSALGWTERSYLIGALTMGVVANVAIALAGTTSQDLKTGFLVGATPKYQQVGEILGILFPSIFIGGIIYLLNETYTIGSAAMPAPQGTMLALIAKGVMTGDLPVQLVMVGVIIAGVVQMLRLPVLPFAIGLYLPLSLTTPMMAGGVMSLILAKIAAKRLEKECQVEAVEERAKLLSSGLIAGDACMGVLIAFFAFLGWTAVEKPPYLGDTASIIVFALFAIALSIYILKVPKKLRR